MSKPTTSNYIGITGFTEPSQINTILERLTQRYFLSGRKLMCGVVLSKARLENRTPAYPNRYPEINLIPEIFADKSVCLNLIHYRPSSTVNLNQELFDVLALAGPYCHGIQVNPPESSPLPDQIELMRFKDRITPQHRIVIQIGRKAIQENSLALLTEICLDYENIITDLLIDQSGGTGNYDHINNSLELAVNLDMHNPKFNIGIAGGLDSNNVAETVNQIKTKLGHAHFNLDAESKLRDPIYDTLDIYKSIEYVKLAGESLH